MASKLILLCLTLAALCAVPAFAWDCRNGQCSPQRSFRPQACQASPVRPAALVEPDVPYPLANEIIAIPGRSDIVWQHKLTGDGVSQWYQWQIVRVIPLRLSPQGDADKGRVFYRSRRPAACSGMSRRLFGRGR